MAFSVFRIGIRPFTSAVERNVTTLPILKKNSGGSEFTRSLVDPCRMLCRTKPVLASVPPLALNPARRYSKHTKPHKAAKHHEYKSDSDFHSSSDSDNEALGRRGESDFWRRKMRTFHGILDVNKDGVISYDDFKLLADRFVDLGHLSDKHQQEFQDLIKDLWIKLWGEITPYNLVTVERYLEDMHHVLNDKSLKRKVHSFLPYLFKAIDKDKSGKINVDDFKLFFKCLGLNEVDAIFSFRTIDTNGDGKLTKKEFITHGREFFLTEDPECISKYFWGPLIEH